MPSHSRNGDWIVVTGATGFVGANLALRFAAARYRVLAIDSEQPSEALLRAHQRLGGQIEFVGADVTDRQGLDSVRADDGIEGVIHAAAVTATVDAEERLLFQSLARVNVWGSASVLDWAKTRGARRVIYVSSLRVYTPTPGFALSEDSPTIPPLAYGLTKHAGEQLSLRFGLLHGLSVAVVRLSGPYGPFERITGSSVAQSPVFKYVDESMTTGLIRVSAPQSELDWTYVEDVAEGILRLYRRPSLGHRVYNLSSGVPTSLADVGHAVAERLGARIKFADTGRNVGIGHLAVDRYQAECGPHQFVSLREGVGRYVSWLSDEYVPYATTGRAVPK